MLYKVIVESRVRYTLIVAAMHFGKTMKDVMIYCNSTHEVLDFFCSIHLFLFFYQINIIFIYSILFFVERYTFDSAGYLLNQTDL